MVGSTLKYSQGLEYTYVSAGDYCILSSIGSCTDENIVIPPIYNGKPIYAINGYAFDCVTNDYDVDIKSVVIGENILVIGKSAFHSCKSLESVVISSSVTSILDFAFYECEALKRVTIYKGVDEIGDWAFFGCSSLTDVYYTGTEEDWSSISITNSYDYGNAELINAKKTL